jgi:hypothetical protein
LFTPPLPPDPARERRRFIIGHGVLRYGLGLGLGIFVWAAWGEYAGPLEHLRTPSGWLRLLVLLVLCVTEWVLGAGWLIGHGLWYLHQHPMPSADRPGDGSVSKPQSCQRDR